MRRALLYPLLLLAPACAPPPAPPVAAAPARPVGNALCPVSGQPVAGSAQAPAFSATFEGETIGFMCPVCVREFERASPEQQRRWLAEARRSAR